MKELSIKEKAKRYDEAIEKATALYKAAEPMSGCNVLLETVFPELKESEDERIRKILRERIIRYDPNNEILIKEEGISQKQFLAWIEKQGEHANFRNKIQIGDKVTRNRDGVLVNLSQLNRVAKKDEKQDEQKAIDTDNKFIRMRETKPKDISEFLDRLTTVEQEFLWEHIAKIRELDKEEQTPTDKAEPKFHDGDYIVYRDYVWKVFNISLEKYYELLKINNEVSTYSIEDIDNNAHLWTIKDAKDGDVLTYNDSKNNIWVCIFKEYANERVYDYCTLDKESFWEYGNWNYLASFSYTPATKEQRDLLFQKMKEAGYEWDADKKELKKIEQKPAEWSKKDNDMLYKVIHRIEQLDHYWNKPTDDEMINWLESLKDRVQPKQEWSEEDDKKRKCLIKGIEDRMGFGWACDPFSREEYIDWLKSLRPQNWTKEDKERYISCLQKLGTGNPKQPETINSKWFKEHVYPQTTWKPSDEQIDALYTYIYNPQYFNSSDPRMELVESVYKDLRKLKG